MDDFIDLDQPVTVTLSNGDWDTVRVALLLYKQKCHHEVFATMIENAYDAIREQTTATN